MRLRDDNTGGAGAPFNFGPAAGREIGEQVVAVRAHSVNVFGADFVTQGDDLDGLGMREGHNDPALGVVGVGPVYELHEDFDAVLVAGGADHDVDAEVGIVDKGGEVFEGSTFPDDGRITLKAVAAAEGPGFRGFLSHGRIIGLGPANQ